MIKNKECDGCANTNTICIMENYIPEQLRISGSVSSCTIMYSDNVSRLAKPPDFLSFSPDFSNSVVGNQ
ncbi:unnamed protein product [Rotaria magnacalcarata]